MRKSWLPILVLLSWAAFSHPGAADSESAAEWREDLRTLAEALPRTHVDAFHAVSREQWERRVAELDRELPVIDRNHFVAGLMRLVAAIGDGHTSLNPLLPDNAPLGFHGVGARLYAFSDGIFVRSSDPAHRDLVGARVVGVGGVPVEEAFRRVAETVSRDNDEGLKLVVPAYFGIPEILAGVGLGDGRSVRWELEKDGRRFPAELPAVPLPYHGHGGGSVFVDPPGWIDSRVTPAPLWLKDASRFRGMEYLTDSRILYVQYNAVMDGPGESIAAFFARVFRFADDHPVDRLVLDIRLNSGGNNFLNTPIVRGVLRHHRDERGKLFVVIGRSTFSAAQNLVNDLAHYAEPTFVGEPTGSRPSQYGDHDPIVLPRSKIVVMASRMYLPDRSGPDPRPWTSPDLPAPLSFADYRDGRDPALEAIERYRSIAAALAPALASEDSAAVERTAREFASNPATAGIPTEREMNAVGYRLLSEGKIALSITVFRLNAERYPESANVHDSLGEAYLAAGDLARAQACYEKALAISPGSANASRMLRTIDERKRGTEVPRR